MPGSLRIGKIFGIYIDIHASWLIIFVLLTISLATGWFPQMVPHQSFGIYLLLGGLASILLFASVLAHELAHSLVAQARGLPVKSITLFIFGGVSNLEREPRSPGLEFWMALVGPLTSLVIGGIALPVGVYLNASDPLPASVLEYLGAANLLLGVFNLIPGFPLDGGRVLRAVIWKATGDLQRATRWASRIGQLIAYLFILVGVWQFFSGEFVGGLWYGFIGWFLLNAASAEANQVELASLFRGVTVREAMDPLPVSVPSGLSIQQLVDEYILPRGLPAIPVTHMGQLIGIISLADIRSVPREQWPFAAVSQAMTPLHRLEVAHPEQPLDEVFPLLTQSETVQLPVVENGRLVGILNKETLMRMLDIRRGLGGSATERVDDHRERRAS